jgi:Na+/H+-translocating membrane pyrophosphatase
VRRAGALKSLTYFLMPPVLGALIGGLFLTGPAAVPWVLGASLIAGLVGFLLATPLATRSDELRKAGYRRAAELAILVGFVAGCVVAYTLVVYLLLGFRRPWAAELLAALFGG